MWKTSRSLINTVHSIYKRNYHVLAIESSCDDSSVCIIERDQSTNTNNCLWHQTKTLDSTESGGIIPSEALVHHAQNIAPMVQEALQKTGLQKVDIVCATRGPGMYASIASGFNVAKGLAVAWNVPLIGVHHMLGHLLMPRYFSDPIPPSYPFLSLLASGKHTMLVLSKSISEHEILADTLDNAIGNSIDKCAREIGLKGNSLGKRLEELASNNQLKTSIDKDSQKLELETIVFPTPLKRQSMLFEKIIPFSFAGFISALRKVLEKHPITDDDTRSIIGTKIQHALFQHLVSRVKSTLELKNLKGMDFVLAGGVASNKYLREMLVSQTQELDMKFHFLDPKFCTDNALMIGWAGIELWENCKMHTQYDTVPIVKWPLTDIMNTDGWITTQ